MGIFSQPPFKTSFHAYVYRYTQYFLMDYGCFCQFVCGYKSHNFDKIQTICNLYHKCKRRTFRQKFYPAFLNAEYVSYINYIEGNLAK